MLDLHPHRDYVVEGDNLAVLAQLAAGSVQLVYIDPPFNTGRAQRGTTRRTTVAAAGERNGFRGLRHATIGYTAGPTYDDDRDDYLGFLAPRLIEAHRILDDRGTIYVHLDYREVHYVKVMMDGIFSRRSFLNEIVWAYDYGARSRSRWPAKHDTILVYVKDPRRYHFDPAAVDREPYMAPGLVSADKAALGKLPTDVWWHTIVSPTGREKTGYPTQKPEAVIRRMVLASSRPGDRLVDFFAGSGTLGAVAAATGRRYLLVDDSADALAVMGRRLGGGATYLRVVAGSCVPTAPPGGAASTEAPPRGAASTEAPPGGAASTEAPPGGAADTAP